ncbi:MAG: hypothetical protein ABIH25_01160 [Candidatus Woesearchaeota archaeon]
MDIKINLGESHRLRKIGAFNFNNLYEEMREWIDNHKYEFDEKGFTSKDLDTGKEIIVDWIGEREITDEMKYIFKINFLLKKILPAGEDLVKGIIEISFKANLEVDYRKKWGQTKLSNFLFNLYTNYIIKQENKRHYGKLYNEITELHDLAKEVLEFYK